ncbi:uncharacterized protein N7482_010399 [Penicillium canariense]|uniref:Wax synthase domain-containing protein n=1 Tax=Penicillium canariense TaxID=189055 RepID=A0A9W9LED3_9EURO|nr:uncharacterized protein N7482_010399 [Penicillium canariense]KAJ5151147.1 hypothetical protein N7482_010399 [Penicillium canariense]
MEIVWSSFGVIILCTWSILAVHVPEQLNELVPGNSKFKSTLRELARACYPTLIKLGWMLFTFLVPEFVFGKALNGYLHAREVEKAKRPGESDKKATTSTVNQEQVKGWTATHTMLADIGGFSIDFRGLPLPSQGKADGDLADDHGVDVPVPCQGDDIEQGKNSSASTIKVKNEKISTHAVTTGDRLSSSTDAICIAAHPEDPRLTDFIQRMRQAFSSLGGIDWQPHPDHRSIINQLASEGHIPDEWSFEQFNEWARSPFYALCGDRWILNATQILLATERGLITLPSQTASERVIHDKSKSSGLIILLALVQIVQLAASLINRAAQGIAISQLEMLALAYGVCGIATYLLQWSCPKDVGLPIFAPALRPASKEDVLLISRQGQARWWWGGMLHFGRTHTIPYLFTPRQSISHDVGTLIALVVFGSFHLVAWRFSFPSDTERLLWQIASLAITVIPAVILVVMALLLLQVSGKTRSGSGEKTLLWFSLYPMILVSALFTLVRLFLIVEAFRSLYFLPPSAYIATRSSNIPGIG